MLMCFPFYPQTYAPYPQSYQFSGWSTNIHSVTSHMRYRLTDIYMLFQVHLMPKISSTSIRSILRLSSDAHWTPIENALGHLDRTSGLGCPKTQRVGEPSRSRP